MLHPRNPTLDFCRMPMPALCALCVRFTPASDLNTSRCRPKSVYSMHGGPRSYFSYTCAAVPGTKTSPIGETMHLLDHAMDSFLDPNGNQPVFFRTTSDRSRPSSLLQTAWQRTGSLLSVCSLKIRLSVLQKVMKGVSSCLQFHVWWLGGSCFRAASRRLPV